MLVLVRGRDILSATGEQAECRGDEGELEDLLHVRILSSTRQATRSSTSSGERDVVSIILLPLSSAENLVAVSSLLRYPIVSSTSYGPREEILSRQVAGSATRQIHRRRSENAQ